MSIEFRKTAYGDTRAISEEYISIENNGNVATLDGTFDIYDLQQILAKMKELQSEVKDGSR